MKMYFRVYSDYSMLDTRCLQLYFKDNKGDIYVVKNIVLEKYKQGECFEPINRLCYGIEINDDELKRMSKELWSELSDETAYLKGELKATEKHLQDMRDLVFKKK